MKNIIDEFQTAHWYPAQSINRWFVKYVNSEVSPGTIWHYIPPNIVIKLSIIIPTIDAHRGGYFQKLLSQISSQVFKAFEIIVVRGDPRQGRAINIAAAIAQGKYLLTLDDDTSLPDPMTFTKLVSVMEENFSIGIAGGNNTIPKEAKLLVRRAMREIPRRSWEPVSTITDSDLAEHPCMIMRAEEFKAIGGENELIPRGLDPYLRQEYRKRKKRVVVIPKVLYHHLPPNTLKKLLKQFYRNGRQAAFTNYNFPQWVIETPVGHGQFKERQSIFFRILRLPIRLLKALLTGKPIWFVCETFYALGFAKEWIFIKSEK